MFRFLYVALGQIITYGFIISFLSIVLALPFLAKPSWWDYQIHNIKVSKYCVVLLAVIITFTTTNVTIQ